MLDDAASSTGGTENAACELTRGRLPVLVYFVQHGSEWRSTRFLTKRTTFRSFLTAGIYGHQRPILAARKYGHRKFFSSKLETCDKEKSLSA